MSEIFKENQSIIREVINKTLALVEFSSTDLILKLLTNSYRITIENSKMRSSYYDN
jgi:hypothetical protein